LKLDVRSGHAMLGAALPADSLVVIDVPLRPNFITCAESYLDQIVNVMNQSADLRTPFDPMRECDAVSIGLEAFAREVGPFSAIVPTPAVPCTTG
jgi:hypothetical protein